MAKLIVAFRNFANAPKRVALENSGWHDDLAIRIF